MKKIVLFLLIAPFIAMAQTVVLKKDVKVKFLALGDSYTIGESVPVKERWPVQLIDALSLKGLDCSNPRIIATTGWRTDNLRSAIKNANLSSDYTLVSLLIGVNDFYQGRTIDSYKPEFEELLKTAIKLAGGDKTKVFVVSIPDFGYTPFGKSSQPVISRGIDEFNNANRSITKLLGVTYVTITDISRRGLDDPSLVAGDGLHPSGKMYSEWVTRIVTNFQVTNGNHLPPTDEGNNSQEDEDLITGADNEKVGLRLSPNPFYNHLTFENLPVGHQLNLSIYDGQGRQVILRKFNASTSLRVDTAALSSGIYYYQLYANNQLIAKGNVFKKM
jgi:lysophospholipase L1-like esterase